MYSIEIGYVPDVSVVGHVSGNTKREVREQFVAWKLSRGIRLNDGNYFLCW